MRRKEDAAPQTLFTNANIFDGKADQLIMGQDVLVESVANYCGGLTIDSKYLEWSGA